MMRLHINGEERELELAGQATLQAALEQLEVGQGRGVAVAVNDRVVPRSQWAERALAEGDRVEIIRATQGG